METRHELWTVPELWPGTRHCAILGGGPSLKDIDVNRLSNWRVICVNNAYQLAPWADIAFYGDCRWWGWHSEALKSFGGLIVSACDGHAKYDRIRVVHKCNSPRGIIRDRTKVSWNLSSGACAVNLAVHFGAKRIVLFGFDMRKVDGNCNWHVAHPPSTNPKHDPYTRFLTPWVKIREDLDHLGIEVINATPGSALQLFPMIGPAEILSEKAQVAA